MLPEAAPSKLCSVPFSLQNRALFEGEQSAKRCREKGRKRGGQQRGQKKKRTRENRSVNVCVRVMQLVPISEVGAWSWSYAWPGGVASCHPDLKVPTYWLRTTRQQTYEQPPSWSSLWQHQREHHKRRDAHWYSWRWPLRLDVVRCCFAHRSCKISEPDSCLLVVFHLIFHDSSGIWINFNRFSLIFDQFRSISISFCHFHHRVLQGAAPIFAFLSFS